MAGNSVNFYDYATEDENFKRRQALVDAMQQQAMQPLQPVHAGNMTASPSLLGVIAKILQARQAKQGQEQLLQDRTTAAERFNTGMQEGFEKFQKTSDGYSAPSMAQVPNPDGSPQQTAVPGDRRKAIFEALASGHPVLRDFALKQLAAEGKDALHPKELLPYADPSSIPAIAQKGVAGFIPKKDIRTLDKTFYDVSGGAPKAVGGTTYSQVPLPHGLGQRDNVTGELSMVDKSPKVNVNASTINKGQNELAIGRAKAANEDLAKAEAAAAAGQQALGIVQKMRMTNDTYKGPMAPAAMWLGQLADATGVKVDRKKLANSETFESESARMWVNLMDQAGGARGLVKEESDRIARAVPQLIHSPQGREQLFAMIEARAADSMKLARTKQQAMSAAAKADNPNMYFEALAELGVPGDFSPQTPVMPTSTEQTAPSWLPPGFKIRGIREK